MWRRDSLIYGDEGQGLVCNEETPGWVCEGEGPVYVCGEEDWDRYVENASLKEPREE